MLVQIQVQSFEMGSDEDRARKVCEEAMEFYAQHVCKRSHGTWPLLLEIGDVFTALVNYCVGCGIDPQKCIDLVYDKNKKRGRYDKVMVQCSRDTLVDSSSEQCGATD